MVQIETCLYWQNIFLIFDFDFIEFVACLYYIYIKV